MKHYKLSSLITALLCATLFNSGCASRNETRDVRDTFSLAAADKIELPSLAVSLGMSVDEVAQAFKNIDFKHTPEQRWQRDGHSFLKREEIRCDVVHLRSLNDHLLSARFIFKNHQLFEVALTLISVQNSIRPLVDALDLHQVQPGVFEGLNGGIVMREDRSDAEKATWIISRK
jgi:hypothetical protein